MTFTISDSTPLRQYNGTGSQTAFSVPFEWRNDSDLVVRVDGWLKVLNTDYTLTGAGVSGGGTCTFTIAPASNAIIVIYGDMPIARTADQFAPYGPLPADALEASLDDITMKTKQVERDISRSLHISPYDTSNGSGFELPLPATRAGKILRFSDPTGAPEMATSIGATVLSRSVIGGFLYPQTVAEVAAAVTPSDYAFQAGDARRYGYIGDGVADDTTAVRNAGKGVGADGEPFVPGPITRLTGSISSANGLFNGQRWAIQGKIKTDNGFNFDVFDFTGLTDVVIDRIEGESGTLGVAYSSATARLVKFGTGATDCSVGSIKATGFQSAVQMIGCTRCHVDYLRSKDPIGWGFNIQSGALDSFIAEVDVDGSDNEHGGYFAGSSGNPVSHCGVGKMRVRNCAIDGLKFSFADDCWFGELDSASNGGENLYVTQSVHRLRFGSVLSYDAGGNGALFFCPTVAITGATQANPCVVTAVAHNWQSGERVYISGVGGMTQINDLEFTITRISADTFSLNGINSTGYGAYTSGGLVSTIIDDVQGESLLSRLNDKNGLSLNRAVRRLSIGKVLVDDNDQEATGTQYGVVLSNAGVAFNNLPQILARAEVIGINISASGPADNDFDSVKFDGCATNVFDGGVRTKWAGCYQGSATWNPASIADGDEEIIVITVTGAALGDLVEAVSFSLDVQDLALSACVTATDTVEASLLNNTGGAIDLGSGTVRVRVRPKLT
jgi:hypothetical protein